MVTPAGPLGDAPLRLDTFRLTRRNKIATTKNEPGATPPDVEESPEEPQARPSLWTSIDSRAKTRANQRAAQLRQRLEGQVDGPPLGPMFGVPGDGPPPAQSGGLGGIGGLSGPGDGGAFEIPPHPMMSDAGQANAAAALAEEGTLDPNHQYVQEKSTARRQLGQLGIPLTNDNRLHVYDVNRSHGNAVTRTLAGETALSQGAAVTLDAPTDEAHAANEAAYQADDGGIADPTSGDLVRKGAGNLIANTRHMGGELLGLTMANAAAADGKKTFVNMSLGRAGS